MKTHGTPEEYRNFESLTKRLMSIPKSELDKKVGEYESRKARRKTSTKRPKRTGGK